MAAHQLTLDVELDVGVFLLDELAGPLVQDLLLAQCLRPEIHPKVETFVKWTSDGPPVEFRVAHHQQILAGSVEIQMRYLIRLLLLLLLLPVWYDPDKPGLIVDHFVLSCWLALAKSR